MPRPAAVPVLLIALLEAVATAFGASADWAGLKAGMSEVDARRMIGEPLIRTRGRGFEVWIYDGKGEMLFAGGPLQAWTPANPSAESLARPVTQDVLIKPVRNLRLPRLQSLPVSAEYLREVSSTRFRYR